MNKIVLLMTVIGLILAGCSSQLPTTPATIIPAPTDTSKPLPTVTSTLESVSVLTSTPEPTPAPTSSEIAPALDPEPTSAPASDFAALRGNIAKGDPAPDFTVTTLAGETFTLSEQRGSPVFLTFMAIGCPSCLYEITSLAEAYPAYAGRGLVTLVVDVQGFDTTADLQPYIDSLPYPEVNWTIDAEFRVGQLYNVFDTGTTVLIDPTGRIMYQDNGPSGPEDLEQLLKLAVP